jgi:ABC-type branched-subunit amino acid transport system ATPase component
MTWSFPTERRVPILFARSVQAGLTALAGRAGVILHPTQDRGWNDFSYRMHMDVAVLTDKGVLHSYSFRMLVDGERFTSGALSTRLGSNRDWMPLGDNGPVFVSMLQRESEYALRVQQLGFDLAVAVLRATGDAVVLGVEGGDPDRLALLASEPFHLAVLREHETYTAYRRAARHLRPQPAPVSEDAAASLVIATRLRSVEAPHIVDVDFEPDPLGRDRLAVLIGPNGAGKTQLMLSMLDGLRPSNDGPLLASARRRPHLWRLADEGFLVGPPVYNRVVVFSSTLSDVYPQSLPPWEIDYQFFSMTGVRDRSGDALTTSLVDCLRDDRRVTFDPLPPEQDDAEDLDFGDRLDRLKLLQSLLEPLGLWSGLHLPLTTGEGLDFAVLTWDGRAYFPIGRNMNEKRNLQLVQHIDLTAQPVLFRQGEARRLSSGETAMLRFAAQAVAAVEAGSLFLFDEPETHLHPSFISAFAEILHRLLKQTRSVALIATHSVYIVRETPSRRVRIITTEDDGVVVGPPRLQTFGASLDSISHAVFGDGEQRHRFQRTLDEWLSRSSSPDDIESILETHGADLSPETLSYLARRLARSRGRPEG